jgi:hypothetical protein
LDVQAVEGLAAAMAEIKPPDKGATPILDVRICERASGNAASKVLNLALVNGLH